LLTYAISIIGIVASVKISQRGKLSLPQILIPSADFTDFPQFFAYFLQIGKVII